MHDFVILEYRDTIGGRAWHKSFGEDKDGKPYTIEMGANWVCMFQLQERTPLTGQTGTRYWQGRRSTEPDLGLGKS